MVRNYPIVGWPDDSQEKALELLYRPLAINGHAFCYKLSHRRASQDMCGIDITLGQSDHDVHIVFYGEDMDDCDRQAIMFFERCNPLNA